MALCAAARRCWIRSVPLRRPCVRPSQRRHPSFAKVGATWNWSGQRLPALQPAASKPPPSAVPSCPQALWRPPPWRVRSGSRQAPKIPWSIAACLRPAGLRLASLARSLPIGAFERKACVQPAAWTRLLAAAFSPRAAWVAQPCVVQLAEQGQAPARCSDHHGLAGSPCHRATVGRNVRGPVAPAGSRQGAERHTARRSNCCAAPSCPATLRRRGS